jgi:hypothetical protein
MTAYVVLFSVWGLVTLVFIVLLVYRSRLTSQESDWIDLTDDEREERAIQAQTIIEMKTQKLTFPIRALGTVSLVLLLVIAGYWVYMGIMTPPPVPK